MPDPATAQTTGNDAIARAKAAGNAVYDAVNSAVNDPRHASQAASSAISHAIAHTPAVKTVIDTFLLLLNPLLTAFFSTLGEVRKGVTESMGATTAEVLNEFLGTSFDQSVLATGGEPDQLLAKCEKIGTAILDRLEFEFTRGEKVTPESGAKGARTFAGYGANFGIQSAIVSLIGSLVPEVHLDDLRELGVEVAGNLGLGGLVQSSIAPIVTNTVVKPYSRYLQAKYQMDLMGPGELARAYLAARLDKDRAMTLLRQWGYSDDQITEFIEQHKPRLRAAEWNVLAAHGETPSDPQALSDVAVGMPKEWIDARQKAETWHRLQRPRQRALQAVISQISSGFLQPADLDKLLTQLQVPDDEQTLWRLTAGYLFERTRKRISQGDMLFLFEAAQVTQDDVREWAREEGYSAQDQERIVLFFELKAAEASHKTTGGAAARAAHLHKEHIAYVTDEITGIFGRVPTAAELNYWVTLLDTGERTKHDFVTELRALDPGGQAIPPTG